jgi:hypothetical protein
MSEESQNQPEQVVARWTEPARIEPAGTPLFIRQVTGASAALAIVMGLLGYFQHDFTFYMASVASIVAGFFLISQRRRPHPQLDITLTSQQLQVGTRTYFLGDIAGFWFETDEGQLLINIEPAKAATFPISFLYPNTNEEEARSILLQAMAEVEPRRRTTADSISRYFRI